MPFELHELHAGRDNPGATVGDVPNDDPPKDVARGEVPSIGRQRMAKDFAVVPRESPALLMAQMPQVVPFETSSIVGRGGGLRFVQEHVQRATIVARSATT